MDGHEVLNGLVQAVADADASKVKSLVQTGLKEGLSPMQMVSEGLSMGMRKIGQLWNAMEVFLPEVMASAEAYYAGLEVVKPLIDSEKDANHVATVVIGTIYGDVHTVGKDVMIPVLRGENFRVIDLGIDVKPQQYIDAVKESGAQVVGLGTYMSETFMHAGEVIKAFEQAGLRDRVIIVCGGPAVDSRMAKSMGADDAFNDAWKAVAAIKEMVASHPHAKGGAC